MKKWLPAFIVILLCFLLLVLLRPVSSDEQRTISSLKQIDDFPLYEMHYYLDYGFAEFLNDGGGFVPNPISQGSVGDPQWACTVFAAMDTAAEVQFGRNFDWFEHPALLLFTDPQDGYASVSMVDIWYLGYQNDLPSVYDRQQLLRAPYLPFDGMNEAGLGVGMMAVRQARGGRDESKMTLEDLEVMRLLLDYAATVDEAIALLEHYNVIFDGPPLHYLVADRNGNSAVLEFIDDQMHVLRNQHPWQVSTNFILSEEKPEGATSPCWRYNAAYQELEKAEGSLSSQQAMDLLAQVSQGGDYPTIWSVVYNLSSGQVSVVVDRDYEQVYRFQVGQ